MKKVLLAVATVAFIFGMASCDKKCHCKTYVNGEVVSENDFEIDDDVDKKCSDFTATTEINDKLNGVKCR